MRFSGTTSACAENTCSNHILRKSMWNYLRVRGEYAPVVRIASMMVELPPRARRIPRGNPFPLAHNRNYLRVRGEYKPQHGTEHVSSELPPRARRILYAIRYHQRVAGTTSACAENTGE